MSDEKTKGYPVTKEIIDLVNELLAGGTEKSLLAASVGVTISCVDQWLRGDTKGIRAENYVALVVQSFERLTQMGWFDPMPEFTMKKFGKTMDGLHADFVAQGEKFLMALRPAKQRESKSNGVSFVCADCGKPLATKVMTKSGSFVVGVERCETCNKGMMTLVKDSRELAAHVGELVREQTGRLNNLQDTAMALVASAKKIEKAEVPVEEAPQASAPGTMSGA